MARIGVWQIQQHGTSRLKESSIGLEKKLEDWIEADPSLLQDGLTIIARQLICEGGRLDLLALDPQGRLVIIEIKAATLRNETIGQALYYAGVLDRMPFADLEKKVNEYLKVKKLEHLLKDCGVTTPLPEGNRDLKVLLVGTSLAPGLEMVVNYLGDKYEFPLEVVAFDVFENSEKQKILVRQVAQSESKPKLGGEKVKAQTTQTTMADLEEIAVQNGNGGILTKFMELAARHDFHTRIYASSVMFAPPQNKTRMLFTIWPKGKAAGKFRIWVGSDTFAQFYPVTEEKSRELLGNPGDKAFDRQTAEEFILAVDKLLSGESQEED